MSAIKLHSDTDNRGTVYFLHKYYPVKHFDCHSLDQDSLDFRANLFRFKDGVSDDITLMFAKELIEAIKHLAPNFDSSQFAFLAMPASSENKTVARYTLLLEILKQEFPSATFLNDYVTFNGERKAKHLSESGISDIWGHFDIGGDVSGKTVLIFDDIITTGRAMSSMMNKLTQMGASDFICLSLGKTVDYRICQH